MTEIDSLSQSDIPLDDGLHNDKFQSVNVSVAAGDMKSRRGFIKTQASNIVPFPGVNLNSLLILSPISELVFDDAHRDAKSGRYQAFIKLNNPGEEPVA